MRLFKAFYPDQYVKNTYVIDFRNLYRRGYRGIIFDIDNTLVPHDAPSTARAALLIRKLKMMGFRIRIVSNNEEPRVKSFSRGVGCAYEYKAGKPGCRGYRNAVKHMGLPAERVIVIGDQLFTDIWGANRSGLHSILVGRISPKEPVHIHLKRILEFPILFSYFLEHKEQRKK